MRRRPLLRRLKQLAQTHSAQEDHERDRCRSLQLLQLDAGLETQ